jgi:hypothetical protein
MLKIKSIAIATAVAAVTMAGALQYAHAQQDQNPPPPRPLRVQQRGGGFARGGGITMAVSGDNLFIVRGNEIFRLDAQTLEVKAKADLPAVTLPPNANFRNGARNRNNGGQGNFRNPPNQSQPNSVTN